MPSVHGGEIVASVIPSAPLGTDAAADRPGLGAATGATPSGDAARRRFRFELAAHPGSVAQARRLAHARLTGWAVCADTCDNAALVISELVTNAIVHTASSRVVCELHDHDDTVRIAVRDEGCAPGEPHPSPQRPDEEHGRGLFLVDALCRSWGAQEHGSGLLVWAELARRADAAQDTDEPRNDLGWGARPKPDRPDDSGDDDPAEAHRRLPEQHRPRTAAEPLRHTPSQPQHRTPAQPQHRVQEQHATGERP
ncbi:ATP-binding protein [Streptomyces sp. NPDC048521]|uniref:ATP-binding protein n=1 Tax=Streptomyces sp. NPDC048521 TaxID=3365566 RepID=UPI0037239C42